MGSDFVISIFSLCSSKERIVNTLIPKPDPLSATLSTHNFGKGEQKTDETQRESDQNRLQHWNELSKITRSSESRERCQKECEQDAQQGEGQT